MPPRSWRIHSLFDEQVRGLTADVEFGGALVEFGFAIREPLGQRGQQNRSVRGSHHDLIEFRIGRCGASFE